MNWALLVTCGILFTCLEARCAEPVPRGFQSRVFKDAAGVSHKYVLFIPQNYEPGMHLPVMLFLHGGGERGDNGIDPLMAGIGPAIWKRRTTFPFLVVFPQCEVEHTWKIDDTPVHRAVEIFKQTQKEFDTDPDRVYVTGLSMGGHGSWALAAKYPDMFAAIVPMCAIGELDDAPKLAAARLPIWNFCGDKDSEKIVTFNREMHDALQKAGANERYTEYPGVPHNCWDMAYGTDELYTWLLAQTRSKNREKK